MNYSLEQRSIISLHLIKDIGPRRIRSLIEYFGSAAKALESTEKVIATVEGIPPIVARAVARVRAGRDAEKEIEIAEKAEAHIFTLVDAGYPEELKNLPDAPPVIYVRGTITDADIMNVAIVGTRHPTAYGRNIARQFATDFARAGVTTISGLARGIDTEVHKSTLESGGRTIAVLGNGLNWHYPPENRALQEKIALHGAVVSEFPMNCEPAPGNFPRRNRIISGLALATIVVEAGIKSGALITAGFALDQGKDVFAVPGPVNSKYSAGPHHLIRQGAAIATSADDVLEEVEPLAALRKRHKSHEPARPAEIGLVDEIQGRILAALEEHVAGLSIDRLSSVLKCPSSALAKSLLDLELRGIIENVPGNAYIVKA